jgi:hypothetical protein
VELPKVTLLVFAVNELIGMKEIMPRIDSDWVDQIIVVDGGSSGNLDQDSVTPITKLY